MSPVKKTYNFGLKPSKYLVFNCPARHLADGAIDIRDIQGFSHINKIYGTFLDWIHGFKSFTGLFSEFTKPVIR
jgi:hypothetical protein